MQPSSNSETDERQDLKVALVELSKRGEKAILWLKVSLAVIVVGLAANSLDFLTVKLIQRNSYVSDNVLLFDDVFVGLVSLTGVVVFITCAVYFLRWERQAYLLVPDLGRFERERTMGWVVGAYFVPFLNLVRPFQMMREIWDASSNASSVIQFVQESESHQLLGIWWALWLVSGFLDQIAFRLSLKPETIEELSTYAGAMVVADVAGIALGVTALALVTKLHARLATKGAIVLASEDYDLLDELSRERVLG